ncbi:MAG: radical SAM protein [Pirellulaceae bacterium]|nr:MAG: radical SAM protein [Pirellulaceae bacterium]
MSSHKSTELFQLHDRHFADQRYVYPVISRRSGGVSVGINLNPDKVCNFDCIYCQVDRRSPGGDPFVELDRLGQELRHTLKLAQTGELFQFEPFCRTPAHLRQVKDIAFSGDGEPTTYRNFDQIVARCAEIKQQLAGDSVKMVLITNASMFHRPSVQQGLSILDRYNGEIWAKLDAGTEEYFRLVDRTPIPFQQILNNIRDAARIRPLVIQSLFMCVSGQPPSDAEIDAYCGKLRWILEHQGQIRYVQVYTVARPPAESYVTPLTDCQVDAIRDRVIRTTGLPAVSFYAAGSEQECAEL